MELKSKPFYLKDEQIKKISTILQSMTEDEKIEQLFCPLVFTNNPDVLKGMISRYGFGAVMFEMAMP
ncbi:MAG: hypothetical protein PF505_14610 [Vallitaleaceae bacterium]|nr:hypothetical protein [Vallitaleaceae bacterium]